MILLISVCDNKTWIELSKKLAHRGYIKHIMQDLSSFFSLKKSFSSLKLTRFVKTQIISTDWWGYIWAFEILVKPNQNFTISVALIKNVQGWIESHWKKNINGVIFHLQRRVGIGIKFNFRFMTLINCLELGEFRE